MWYCLMLVLYSHEKKQQFSQSKERLRMSGLYGPEGLSDVYKFCADVICGGDRVEIDS